jgi:hypothetical protein
MKTTLRRLTALAVIGLLAALAVAQATTQPARKRRPLYNAVPTPPRSPIPLPGETFDKPIRLAITPSTQPAPGPGKVVGEIVPWSQAAKHLGETITVEGTIVDTHNAGEVCFLNFVKGDRKSFYLIMWKESFDKFPDSPERYFLGKKVRATGEVSENRGRPQIRLKDAKQVWVVE